MPKNRLSVHHHVEASPQEVFAVAADFPNAARVIQAIETMQMLTEGPVGVGTRFRETRKMFGKEATEVMEVAVFEPPHRYVLHAESHGSKYVSGLTFEPEDAGTRVTMHFDAEPLSFFAKVMSFLMKPMMKKMGELCRRDLKDLGDYVERKRR